MSNETKVTDKNGTEIKKGMSVKVGRHTWEILRIQNRDTLRDGKRVTLPHVILLTHTNAITHRSAETVEVITEPSPQQLAVVDKKRHEPLTFATCIVLGPVRGEPMRLQPRAERSRNAAR